ncbi:MAG: alpha/beta hydrolase [Caldithrix sp.]|nr:alpha/beta hydrolase [Caldithrix sp.]
MVMGKILIGIHGLKNKPPQLILEMWWRKALLEGLRMIGHHHPFLKFALVYWADCLHDQPQNPFIESETDPLYVSHPYVALKDIQTPAHTALKQKMSDHVYRHLMGDKMFSRIPGLTNWFLRNRFKDFYIYFGMDHDHRTETTKRTAIKKSIQKRLRQKLQQHKDDEILLIAHSMGAIIAFEVLTELQENINVHTLITIGAPLTLPFVFHRLQAEEDPGHNNKHLYVPSTITRQWYNLYDEKDKIARKADFSKKFHPNDFGVGVQDIRVDNTYVYNEEAVPHNIFGYLRTPEMAGIVNEFIEEGQAKWILHSKRLFNRLFSLVGKH